MIRKRFSPVYRTIRTKIDEAPESIVRGVHTYSDPTKRHCKKERSGVSTKRMPHFGSQLFTKLDGCFLETDYY